MENILLDLDENGYGHFYLSENKETLGEMEVTVDGNLLTVYHTEVLPKAEGTGLAKRLLNEMVGYARKNHLKVKALCPYVLAQFKRHPDEYADIWDK